MAAFNSPTPAFTPLAAVIVGGPTSSGTRAKIAGPRGGSGKVRSSAILNPASHSAACMLCSPAVTSGDWASFGGRKACTRSEEHTSELQSHLNLVCRLLLEKKKKIR